MVENTPHNSAEIYIPHEAVADAMLVAQGILVDHYMRSTGMKYSKSDISRDSLKLMHFLATEGHCTTASKISLTFLYGKYKDFFDRMTLLTSHDDQERFRENWGMHQYFLVRDTGGTWYAGSPANHSLLQKNDRKSDTTSNLSTLIVSKDLSEVLKQIQNNDGGNWPSVEFVEGVLSIPRNAMPQHIGTHILPPVCRDIFRYRTNGSFLHEVGDAYLYPFRNGQVTPPADAFNPF